MSSLPVAIVRDGSRPGIFIKAGKKEDATNGMRTDASLPLKKAEEGDHSQY
jgi:hypothetical protein